MRELNENLERTRDTVEEQNQQLFDKTRMVDKYREEVCCKDNVIREQEDTVQVGSVVR